MRNTGNLKSDKTLKSGGALGGGGQLIPLKSLGSRKRLRARSEKKKAWFRDERAPFVAAFLAQNPRCMFKLWVHGTTLEESPPLNYTGGIITSCGKLADDVHEIVPQGRGGSAISEKNCIGLCRGHHGFVTSRPAWAREKGYTR